MKRLVVRLSLAIGIVLAITSPALADGPTRTPAPIGTFTVSGICSFDVRIAPLRNGEVNTIFNNAAGAPQLVITTGPLSVRLTNLSSNTSLEVNIPGPGKIKFEPGGTSTQTMEGPWLFFFFDPNALPTFSPRMFLNNGLMVATFDSTGAFTSLTIKAGHPVDLCAALA